MRLLFFSDRATGRDARRLIDRAMANPHPARRATEGRHIEPATVGVRWCLLRKVRGQPQWMLIVDDAVEAMADMSSDAILRTRMGAAKRSEFRALIAGNANADPPECDSDDDVDPGAITNG